MIKEFVSGKWYRYIGPGKETDSIAWSNMGGMDFLLDNKPHQCNRGEYFAASFFDSPHPDLLWSFKGNLKCFEEVEMNDEMKQIEKLEKELARLREIVETKKEKKIVYDEDKLYVGIYEKDGEPFLLTGYEEYYRFHSFKDVENGWEDSFASGQEAIDSAVDSKMSLTVYEFSNALEGMEFFMDKYRKYHKED